MNRLRRYDHRSSNRDLALAARLLGQLEPLPDSAERRERVIRAVKRRRAERESAPPARRWRPALVTLVVLLLAVAVAGATVARRLPRERASSRSAAVATRPARGVVGSIPPTPRTSVAEPGAETRVGQRVTPWAGRRGEHWRGDDTSSEQPLASSGGVIPPGSGGASAREAGSGRSATPPVHEAGSTTTVPVPTFPAPAAASGAGGVPPARRSPSVPPPVDRDAAPGFFEDPPAVVRAAEPEVPSSAAVAPVGPQGRGAVPRQEAEMVNEGFRLLRNQREPRRAGRLLADYIERFPQGALIEEALALSVEAASAAHDLPRARELARTYFRRFPDGQYVDQVKRALDQRPIAE